MSSIFFPRSTRSLNEGTGLFGSFIGLEPAPAADIGEATQTASVSAWRPTQLIAADDVEMEVVDRLASMAAIIDDHSVSALGNPLTFGNDSARFHHCKEFSSRDRRKTERDQRTSTSGGMMQRGGMAQTMA